MNRQTEKIEARLFDAKRVLDSELAVVAESFDTTEVLPEHRHPAVDAGAHPHAHPAVPDRDQSDWRPPADVPAVQVTGDVVDEQEGASSLTHSPSTDRNARGQFVRGNDAWREGQADRLKRASEVRIARLKRTKRLLQTLTLKDMDLTMHVLRGCLFDDDPKVRLAAVKLVLETVTVKDAGEVVDGDDGPRVAFVFQIPSALPVAESG